ncbi:hypothetical protein QE363_002983 [Sphingomonas sp. SORGH_AS870]|uniref:Npun_F0296 family exosortase-dependent surface protein n=1 Tax=Sphingomonas sp. SORGH_AS_0870 TaxID=3041801 RepID=UPI00285B2300|nr:PEP-CTERM sorting domain-containing protein [Sphingomonas sp. SORGH_AS_0870]MDR6147190.1 hypothetical protein [Sphingomonas sp. SORGH_AS_0870]
MKKVLLGVMAAIATLSAAAPASAGVSSTSYLVPPVYARDTTVIDFTNGIPSGFSLNGGTVLNDSTSTGAYKGAIQPSGGSGNYLAVGATNGTVAELKGTGSTGWGAVSLLWGTIDSFNSLDILDTLGKTIATITGADIANGLLKTGTTSDNNRYVTYTVDPSTGRQIGGLRFTSPTDSFEVDNIAFLKPTSVPEPGTIALFALAVLGLGMLRARKLKAQPLAL